MSYTENDVHSRWALFNKQTIEDYLFVLNNSHLINNKTYCVSPTTFLKEIMHYITKQ